MERIKYDLGQENKCSSEYVSQKCPPRNVHLLMNLSVFDTNLLIGNLCF